MTSLQAEIRQLRELVSGASGPDSPRVAESEFALVSEPPQDRISGLSETRVSIDVPHTGYPPAELSTPELDWETRERIARQIGLFLRGALAGEIYGTSGRERIPLKSRLWIVARDHNGVCFNPCRVFRRWEAARVLVKRGDNLGRSVLVGLPSEREAKVAVSSAGLDWPVELEG